ncbi:MAG: CoA-binding protein, partial [Microgenomates group bacterium]
MPVAHHLRPLFKPLSIAVIGASREEKKLGHIIVRNIIESGFDGKVFPVNPKAEAVRGLSCYPEYALLPETPDLAIIAIPAQFILKTLEQISAKGTKHVVILSAGFKEIGTDGAQLENEVAEYARAHQMYILGPNCLGFVTAEHELNATFGQGIEKKGMLRFISQSGAIATSIFDWSAFTGVGFCDFVTLGNKAVLAEHDILEYWLHTENSQDFNSDDQPYHPIGMYLESISNGPKFLSLCRKITQKSPVFIIKPGKSDAAKKAMQSHTGSLAGNDEVLSAALDEVGVIRCEGLEDVFDLSRLFAWSKA